MATFEITGVEANPREWQAKKGPAAGQKFLSYTVHAKGPDGEVGRYEISRRPESQPPALGPDEYMVEPAPFDGALSKLKKSGGNFNAPKYERVPDKQDYWDAKDRRIEWAWACNLAAAELGPPLQHDTVVERARIIREQARKELADADVGGGGTASAPEAPAADVSADPGAKWAEQGLHGVADAAREEASPAQKGKLTQLFGKAGLSRDAMKAVVLYRCRSEKATKDGASKLIQDLMDGATHDTLLAEIHDAKRAGDACAIRAAKLIPSDTPLAPEPVEIVPPNGDDKVPF